MRVQHNILAMNSYRNYSNNVKSLGGNLEKLSSGYKINRAGDDAAGLAISEKMRAQITGLNAAQKNVKDGISFVKTAEGAMQEIQDMLNRMKYLATQSANGTYQDEVDRENLDKEVKSLTAEIDRIAQSANFNGIYMLNGAAGNGGGGDDAAKAMQAVATQAQLDGLNATAGQSAFATAGVSVSGLSDKITKVSINTAAQETGTNDDGKATVAINNGVLSIDLSRANGTGAELDDDKVTAAIKAAITADTTLTADEKKALENVKFEGLADASKLATTAQTAVDITPAAGGAANQAADAADGPTFKGDTAGLAKFGIASVDLNGAQEITAATDVKAEYDGTAGKLSVTVGDKTYTKTFANTGEDAADIKGTTLELDDGAGNKIKVLMDATAANVKIGKDQTTDIDKGAASKIGSLEPAAADNTTKGGNGTGKGAFELTLQIGDDASGYNQMKVQIGGMRTDDIMGQKFTTDIDENGIVTYTAGGGTTIKNISIKEQGDAADAIESIKNAINYVSSVRGDLGATQNRLDHTLNNLSVMAENIQDAESTIRDTDVAEEMMSYVKNNILVQSAQAMLAQANQVPQGVLQLLG